MGDCTEMRKAFTRCGLILAAFLTVSMRPAEAQNITSPYRFIDNRQSASLFAGYFATGKGALNLGPEPAPVFGARYDLILSGPFTLEANLGWFTSTRMVHDTIPGDTARRVIGEADMNMVMALGGLRFNLTGPRTFHRLLPYVLFGAGVAVDLADDAAVEADLPGDVRFPSGTRFVGQLGGGLEWFPTDQLGLRVDARNVLWKLKTPEAFLLRGEQARLLPADEWAQNFSFTAGLVLRF